MIERLTGVLVTKAPHRVVIDLKGIGLEVLIPFSSYGGLPDPGGSVLLQTHLVWREDGPQLFGFLTEAERSLFRLLTTVNKVGPKLALNIMSGTQPERLVEMLVSENTAALTKLKGVGPKLASRLVVELKEAACKLGIAGAPISPEQQRPAVFPQEADVRDALENLGYTSKEIGRALQEIAPGIQPDTPLQTILEAVLQSFSRMGG